LVSRPSPHDTQALAHSFRRFVPSNTFPVFMLNLKSSNPKAPTNIDSHALLYVLGVPEYHPRVDRPCCAIPVRLKGVLVDLEPLLLRAWSYFCFRLQLSREPVLSNEISQTIE